LLLLFVTALLPHRLTQYAHVPQTRQKIKEAYEAEFLATIERAEKQIILARHGLRLLDLLDTAPVVPGDDRPAYTAGAQARQVLNDAEDDLRDWQPSTAADDEEDVAAGHHDNTTAPLGHQKENQAVESEDAAGVPATKEVPGKKTATTDAAAAAAELG
jgi:hypothetical protein